MSNIINVYKWRTNSLVGMMSIIHIHYLYLANFVTDIKYNDLDTNSISLL